MRKQLLLLLTILFSLSVTQLRAEGNWSDDVSAITPERDDLVYRIETSRQLAWVAQKVNDGTLKYKVFILMDDIDLAGKEWTPIGNGSNAFTGCFRGNNHTISNLTVTGLERNAVGGLFGVLEGTVSDLKLTGAEISSNQLKVSVGVLASRTQSQATIENCDVEGSISATGGSSYSSIGGLVGYSSYATILSSKANVSCTIVDYNTTNPDSNFGIAVGGLVGNAYDITVRNCFSSGSIQVGGSWTNSMTTVYAGGLVGCFDTGTTACQIENSASTSAINLQGIQTKASAEISIGGLLGHKSSSTTGLAISNSYYKGTLSSLSPSETTKSNYQGVLVGMSASAVTLDNCFYAENSNLNVFGNVTGTVTGATVIPTDLTAKLNGWVKQKNTDEEYLSWDENGSFIPRKEAEEDVDYTCQDNVCTISTKKGLAWFVERVNRMYETFAGKTVQLAETNDWDMTEKEWIPIGTVSNMEMPYYFAGTFDGNNQTVKIKIPDPRTTYMYKGFFGAVKGGTIKNLTVDGDIYNSGNNAGIVVAQMKGGEISNVKSKGILRGEGSSSIAGIVGNAEGCNITDCVNDATITGRSFIGGIAGNFYNGKITNCVNSGMITGVNGPVNGSGVGGILGNSEGNTVIMDCVNSGSIVGKGTDFQSAGGILGVASNGASGCNDGIALINTINKGPVSNEGYCTGGIIGLTPAESPSNEGNISIINSGNFADISGAEFVGGFGVVQAEKGRTTTIELGFSKGKVTSAGEAKASFALCLPGEGIISTKNNFYQEQDGLEGIATDVEPTDESLKIEGLNKMEGDAWITQMNQYVNEYNAAHPDGPFAKTWKFDANNNPVFGLSAPVIEGKTPFKQETTVTITALAGAKIYYTLDGSDPTSESTPYNDSFTLNDQKTVKAIAIMDGLTSGVAEKDFVPGTFFKVTVSPNDAAMGSVTVITDATPEEGGLYPEGAKLTLTATPNSGYHFKGWSDGQTANPYELNVTGEVALIANFEKDVVVPPYVPSYYDISFEPNDSVLLSANVTTVEEGYSFVVKAEVAEGYDPSTLVVEYKSGRTGRWKTVEPSTNGTYRIRSVYNDIYVRASVEPIDDPTANAVVEGGNRIYAVRDVVYIDRLVPAEAQVLTIGGRIVRHLHLSSGSNQITGLQPGVYVVRLSDGSCRKVSVR